ncbi:putative A/G-specific adenine glycosylase [Pedobacter sp. BAL39]|uniref:A/G-specific adenine glycosylase n=1 Tax=Pedobacter sp. BAL39 TaxID=391596 RepID=UPI00015597EC|nr:A/G-specific adenine glycosylase [Pedobacter sp. BAL39]EDM37579.1 putative A/G-specific adenine glycosylase [Pedobacter sp. BAL39]
MSFQNEIVKWYELNKRSLPWRNTRDPYVIWLSEIILQQTRVEQGLPYFNRFLSQYPGITDFANAEETQILKLWQGLGYYSRGRNMLYTARQIRDNHNGVFPNTYDTLVGLKGIGEYTAAAISSFSSDESKAVLDGNVFRVLSRYFGVDSPINSTEGKKIFSALAQSLIAGQTPSIYNQAIMEFGALQCKPKSPDCPSCPVHAGCEAKTKGTVALLPVKLKKLKKRIRYFNYFVCEQEGQLLVRKRGPGDVWQELYDFPLIETENHFTEVPEQFSHAVQEYFGKEVVIKPLAAHKHLLTHQTIFVQFFGLDNYIINFKVKADIKRVSLSEFDGLPQPKVIANFIESYTTKQ